MSKSSRVQLGAAVAVAFICGVVFASGFDLTRFTWAQASRPSVSAPPPPAVVKSIDDFSKAFEWVANTVTPAVVSIQAEMAPRPVARRRAAPSTPPGMEDFFHQFDAPDPEPREAGGTGFIVSKDGYILTNNHVVAEATKISVRLFDNRVVEAKVIGRDPTTDVALIKVDAGELPVAQLGEDSTAHIGQWVVAIGNPLDLGITVTAGIVSAKGRQLQGLLNTPGNQYAIMDYIQTDAAINPGNSGGPLVNIRGQVIGINSAIASSNGRYQGYGFAIPISLAKRVMDDLIQYGGVRRAVLGVSIDSVGPADAKAAGVSEIRGVKVNGFNPSDDSPAQRAGMEPGDIIVAVDGRPIDRMGTLQRVIRDYKPGQTVTLDVVRFGEKKKIAVKLAEPPKVTPLAVASNDPDEPAAKPLESTNADRLGITTAPVPLELAKQDSVPASYQHGLLVTNVRSSGPSYRAFATNSDIIVRALAPRKQEIRTAADLQDLLKSVKKGDVVSLLVYNTGARGTRVVNLPLP